MITLHFILCWYWFFSSSFKYLENYEREVNTLSLTFRRFICISLRVCVCMTVHHVCAGWEETEEGSTGVIVGCGPQTWLLGTKHMSSGEPEVLLATTSTSNLTFSHIFKKTRHGGNTCLYFQCWGAEAEGLL